MAETLFTKKLGCTCLSDPDALCYQCTTLDMCAARRAEIKRIEAKYSLLTLDALQTKMNEKWNELETTIEGCEAYQTIIIELEMDNIFKDWKTIDFMELNDVVYDKYYIFKHQWFGIREWLLLKVCSIVVYLKELKNHERDYIRKVIKCWEIFRKDENQLNKAVEWFEDILSESRYGKLVKLIKISESNLIENISKKGENMCGDGAIDAYVHDLFNDIIISLKEQEIELLSFDIGEILFSNIKNDNINNFYNIMSGVCALNYICTDKCIDINSDEHAIIKNSNNIINVLNGMEFKYERTQWDPGPLILAVLGIVIADIIHFILGGAVFDRGRPPDAYFYSLNTGLIDLISIFIIACILSAIGLSVCSIIKYLFYLVLRAPHFIIFAVKSNVEYDNNCVYGWSMDTEKCSSDESNDFFSFFN